ncbi:hypothetical protein P171DRAFT_150783 [Karstenula rhodostoma CBS 690.94]|uniref:Uncharacterized protein n=1 Tax=Karstenula rhodostoma CBS 690.94 TaxID=1392251 RepID=A0A9P4PTB7_9PLEO|nr:hypothetical protein P171DRAFT_150783 [Karstenula rhodostoma CBS 690.94]
MNASKRKVKASISHVRAALVGDARYSRELFKIKVMNPECQRNKTKAIEPEKTPVGRNGGNPDPTCCRQSDKDLRPSKASQSKHVQAMSAGQVAISQIQWSYKKTRGLKTYAGGRQSTKKINCVSIRRVEQRQLNPEGGVKHCNSNPKTDREKD